MVVCCVLGMVCRCKIRVELGEGLLACLRGVVEQEGRNKAYSIKI